MTTAAKGFWLAWQDAETGEVFGESTLIGLAYSLAARIAAEPLIDGRLHAIELYQEPRHCLLHRFNLDGSQEPVSKPLIAEELVEPAGHPTPASVQRSRNKAQMRLSTEEMATRGNASRVLRECDQRRLAAGVPADGYRVAYAVDWDAEAGRSLFVELDHERARSRLRELADSHLLLVDSRDWSPLDSDPPSDVD